MQSVILAESVVANTAKSTYQKKYKCPYCDKRFVRAKLHIHIQNEHEDLIPEGYTALRVAFNTINHKTEGHCIMCGAVTDWNEDKGRYERLCNDPKCHEAYKKMVAERTKKKYGTERLQTDPEYAEYVQRKALAGRKMHGEYKFADGGVIEYFGSYEKKFLQFMDQVMHCKSEDILAPAPSIKYMYNGEQHLYIPDFYYIPYNLIIEIKDGGSNPNNHPHRTGEDELKLRCKEEAIKQLNEFSYVRVVNNDFGQVLSIMAVLKYNMNHRYKDPVIKVNESTILSESEVSNIDKNFKPKEKINISSLKRVRITESIIEKYKKQYPDLRQVRCKDTDTYKCDGYIWFDNNNNLVAQVGSCEYLDDKTKWIVSLDIMKDYKGHGLSKQILDFATKTMKCTYLSVAKSNKLAKMIYDDYGFKVYYEDDKMYYMTLEANPVKVNESTILESILINEDDIYYNKDKFDSGEINLCFITGLSGSGKSTMGRDMQSHGVEHYELDDLQCIADHFTLANLKEYGDLIYSYFTGEGKKFYKTLKELKDAQVSESEYEDKLYPGFVHYAMKYAKSHKDRKFVLEGVWLYNKKWFTPEEFKKYAFYIKGTSMIISHIRSAKRDSKSKLDFASRMAKNWKWSIIDEIQINKFRKYFESLMTKYEFAEYLSESAISDYAHELYNWMHENIKYKFDNHEVVTCEELEKNGYGDCHSQANYIHEKFQEHHIQHGRLFMIEYTDIEKPAGKTHTAVYYIDNGKYYWFENAWDNQAGIHGPYTSLFGVKKKIANEWPWGNFKYLFMCTMNNAKLKYGMNLNQYCDAVMPVSDDDIIPFATKKDGVVMKESMADTIGGALPLTPNPIPYESNKDNYYIIQHTENNAFAYSLTKDPVQYTMYSVDPEAKGFYKVFKSDKSKINKKYSTFKIKDRQKAKELYDELARIESSNSKTFFAGDTSSDYIYQRLTEGSKIISDDQIRYDTRFEEVKNFNEEIQEICESVRSFILGDPITRLEEQVSTLSNLVNINESSDYVSSDYDMITSIEDYDNKVLKAKTAEQMGLIILYPEFKYGTCNRNIIDKLKRKYAAFNALTQDKRTLSNRTAYNIFGYDNDTLYSKLLNLYISAAIKSGGGFEGYSYNTMRSITPPIEQYYDPGEKIGTVSSDTKVARESFTDDASWRQVVSRLCLEANNTSDTKKKNDLKNEIINLGWNPEIPFNEEAITRVKNMRHKLHIFTEVDAEEYIRNIHTFNEATYSQLKDKIVPVFICLFKGKALHSRGIELYTGSEWSHAAMAFDSSMKQMYTFNMNPKVTSDGVSKGFTIESIEAYWKLDPSIKFKVHALFVTKEQKAMMEDAIKWYVIHQNETKYSFKTLINIALKRVSDFGSEYANKTEMVCSQFVYTILAIADFKTKVTKDASLVSPGDLDTSIDDRLFSMFIGGIGLYSSKKIDRMVRQIIPTLPLDKYNI